MKFSTFRVMNGMITVEPLKDTCTWAPSLGILAPYASDEVRSSQSFKAAQIPVRHRTE